MKWVLLVLGASALIGCSSGVAPAPERAKETSLPNGLQIVVRPIEGAKAVALVVLYSVGEKHDPEGASGLAHLIEHLYVTSAAADTPARDIDGYLEAYPDGWNAQTGDDYTVIATVFPRARLESEIKDAAARMGALEVQASDLEREIARLDVELGNMYRTVPALAVQNLAAQAVAPPLQGARRGGVLEQIRAIPLEEVRTRLAALYKPGNATLVLAGDVDAAQADSLVAEAFGPLPKGEVPVATDLALQPVSSGMVELTSTGTPGLTATAGVAYRAPRPDEQDYAAFLALVAQLQARAHEFGAPRGVAPVQFSPLDRPDVLIVSAPALEGEDAEMAVGRIERIVRRTVEAATVDRDLVRAAFGFLLGLEGTPESELALNPYGVAFGIARRRQMRIDSATLAQRINALQQQDLDLAADSVFAQQATGRAIVRTTVATPGGFR